MRDDVMPDTEDPGVIGSDKKIDIGQHNFFTVIVDAYVTSRDFGDVAVAPKEA